MTTDEDNGRAGDGVRGRVCIETHGCSYNVSDSEVMAGLLEQGGYEIVNDPSSADAVVINTCTVKGRACLELRKRVDEFRRRGRAPVVILAGCVPRVPEEAAAFAGLSQLGPDNVGSVVEVVSRSLGGARLCRTDPVNAPRLNLPRRRRNPAVEIVPIARGCLGACTYCQTVLARGRLRSFPEEDILAQLREAVGEGVREVWLTAQDCGAYGADTGSSLPRLLRRVAAVPGDFRVRVGMVNPNFAVTFAEELAGMLADSRFFAFAHLPVQSGSARVLREMGRRYTPDDFRTVCAVLRRAVPGITIATDFIVGFPTETDEDFAASLELLREVRPPVVNRSRFSPRPGTAAARMKPLGSAVVSRRSKILSDAFLETNRTEAQEWVGWTGEAIVEETPRPGIALARNRAYKPIGLRGTHRPGSVVTVRVAGVDGFHLAGEVL